MSYNYLDVIALVFRDAVRIVPIQYHIVLVYTSLRYDMVRSICRHYPWGVMHVRATPEGVWVKYLALTQGKG